MVKISLGDAYATKSDLKGYAEHMADTVDDNQIDEVLLQVARDIEHTCRRQFNKASPAAASARYFYPDHPSLTNLDNEGIHDFYSTSDLVIATDTAGDGTYATVWASTDYQLEPLNGMVDGESGWPYYRIRAVGNNSFPTWDVTTIAPLKVTARWGWNAVPTNIKVANIYIAFENLRLKNASFGVVAESQFGPIRVRDNPRLMRMLQPYIWEPILVG